MSVTGLHSRPGQKEQKSEQEFSLCAPSLEEQLRECLQEIRHNQMLFDLETEPELIEQRVYEYRALQCRYGYLQRIARASGLRAFA